MIKKENKDKLEMHSFIDETDSNICKYSHIIQQGPMV